jgi:hypothetical protein
MSILRPTVHFEVPAVAYLVTREGVTVAGPKPCTLVNDGAVISIKESLSFKTEDAGPHALAMYDKDGRRLCEWRFNAQPGGEVSLGGSDG